MHEYSTLRALHNGETVDIENSGILVRKIEGELEPSDHYVAERNTPARLLTVKSVNWDKGWVNPVERAYPYDLHECVRVEIVAIT